MNNPETHCPRCGQAYRISPTRHYCKVCRFYSYKNDNCLHQLFMSDGMHEYTISWYKDYTYVYTRCVSDVGLPTGSSYQVAIEDQLPLDITLEQVKLYLTFS